MYVLIACSNLNLAYQDHIHQLLDCYPDETVAPDDVISICFCAAENLLVRQVLVFHGVQLDREVFKKDTN